MTGFTWYRWVNVQVDGWVGSYWYRGKMCRYVGRQVGVSPEVEHSIWTVSWQNCNNIDG